MTTDLDALPRALPDARQRRFILIAMCTALVAVVASVSGLNVAQQQLATSLGATQSQLLWVINGYTIALAALLLPIGAVGDRWGRRHVLIAGLIVFLGANFAAAMAGSVTQLLIARIVAGAGAAMIMPVTLSVITSSFPEEDRDRAVGVWAGFAGAGGILGLITSSLVVDNVTWPWVFAAPLLMAAIALLMTVRVVPNSSEQQDGRFDVVGSVLVALAVGALVLGIHEGPEHGWTEPLTLAGLGVGLLAAVGFVVWELRQEHPLLNLRVFRNRALASGSLNLMMVFAIMSGLFLILVQFLQAALGYSAIRASVSLLPMAAIMMPLSSVAPLIARRVGYRAMFVVGLGTIAGGLALMASMSSVSGGYWSVVPGLLVMSIGIGLTMTPGTAAITGSLPVEEQGVASALNDTVRELGGAVGIALIGSVMSAGYRASVSDAVVGLPGQAATAVKEGIGGAMVVASKMGPAGQPVMAAARNAFVDGWALSLWVAAGVAAAAAVIAAILTPGRADEVADDVLDAAAVERAAESGPAVAAGDSGASKPGVPVGVGR